MLPYSQFLVAGRAQSTSVDLSRAVSVITPPLPFLAPPRWFVYLALVALAGYAVFLGLNTTVVAGGSDSSGYLNSARLFAEGKLQTDLRVPLEIGNASTVNRYHFSPQGFGLFDSNPRLPPSYPSGLPLQFALAGRIFGWHVGPFLVQLGAALAAVWLLYKTAREFGASYLSAAAGATMLATFPVFIFTSIQTLSDTMATTWTLAACFCGLRARYSAKWAAGCGVALAIAVLVRPTNLLMASGLVVLIGFDLRRLSAFVLGGLPGALWLAGYNDHLYGGPFRSGYGPILNSFGFQWGGITAVHFAKWLALLLPAVVLALPLAALARRRKWGRELVALGLVFGGNIGIYLFYDVSHDVWWCLRFILPAVAVLIVAAVMGLDSVARLIGGHSAQRYRAAGALILTVWALANGVYWTKQLGVMYVPGYELKYSDAAKVLRERAPSNALVLCSAFSGTVYYYTGMSTLVYDSITPDEFARYVAQARGAARPIYAVLFDIEENDSIRTRCPGKWQRVAEVGNIGIWQLP